MSASVVLSREQSLPAPGHLAVSGDFGSPQAGGRDAGYRHGVGGAQGHPSRHTTAPTKKPLAPTPTHQGWEASIQQTTHLKHSVGRTTALPKQFLCTLGSVFRNPGALWILRGKTQLTYTRENRLW